MIYSSSSGYLSELSIIRTNNLLTVHYACSPVDYVLSIYLANNNKYYTYLYPVQTKVCIVYYCYITLPHKRWSIWKNILVEMISCFISWHMIHINWILFQFHIHVSVWVFHVTTLQTSPWFVSLSILKAILLTVL